MALSVNLPLQKWSRVIKSELRVIILHVIHCQQLVQLNNLPRACDDFTQI